MSRTADTQRSLPVAADHPGLWRAAERDRESFCVDLDARHLDALEAALRAVQARTDDPEAITRADFDLGAIAAEVARWRDEVMRGSGLVILRGLSTGRFGRDELGMIFFGLGTHFGTAMPQSVMGDRLGHVVDVGGKDPKERAYRNSTELDMHTDACDLVAMLCLQRAREGGISGYVSALAIYNEILRRAPAAMPILMRGFHYHRFGEEAPGEAPVTEARIPVFSFHGGELSVNYLRSYIEMAAEELDRPLTANEISALDLVDEIALDPDFALRFLTRPGEAVWFNNLTILHNRTAFEDAAEPELKRHFLRLWLVAHEPRPADPRLRIYEGMGITPRPGTKSTYFGGDLDFSRFRDDDGRM